MASEIGRAGNMPGMTAPGVSGFPPPSPPPVGVDVTTAFRRTAELSRPFGIPLAAAAVPTLLAMSVLFLFTVFALPKLVIGFLGGVFSSLFLLVPAIIVGGGLLVGIVSTGAGAAVAARAGAAAQGHPITLLAALRQTRGVLLRALPVWLAYAALQWSLTAGLGWWLQRVRETSLTDPNAAESFGIQLLLGMAAAVALSPVGILVQIKFFLFVPVITFERIEGFSALRRSWKLTKGAGATILVGQLAGWAITGGIATVAVPLIVTTLPDPQGYHPDPTDPTSYVLAGTLLAATQLAYALITPLLWLFSTVVYRFQVGLEKVPGPRLGAAPPRGYGYPAPPPPPLSRYGYPAAGPVGPPPPLRPPSGGFPPPPPQAPRGQPLG